MKRLTTEFFIEKAKKVHGDKYDYSLVDYKDSITKLKIICPVHGIFYQNSNKHLSGRGCQYCTKTKKLTIENFKEKANKKHNNKYDYSLVEYKNNKSKIKIICPEHGVFEQNSKIHLDGSGCPKCNGGVKYTKKKFINKANKIHNSKYDYSLIKYKNSKTKLKIICTVHGVFEQIGEAHLIGQGCPKCAKIKHRLNIIKRIENNKLNGNQLFPNFNPKACEIFDKISEQKNIHIQHAMNGGEYYIKELGYWVDGYDTINNVVYEFDEKHHKYQKEKDKIREQEIINFLKCDFNRIKE